MGKKKNNKIVNVSKAKIIDLDNALSSRGVDGNKLSYAEKVKIGEVLFPNGIEVEIFTPNWNYISSHLLGITGVSKRQFVNPYYKVIDTTQKMNDTEYHYTYYALDMELNGKKFTLHDQKPDEIKALTYFYIWEELMIIPMLELNFVENNAWDTASDAMKKKYKDYIGKTPREMIDLKRKANGYYIKTIDEIVTREMTYGGKHLEFVKNKIRDSESKEDENNLFSISE